MSKAVNCILSKNTWIYPTPVLPGVWRCREEGHFLIRAQPKSPLTGKKTEIRKVVEVADAPMAFTILQEEIAKIRNALVRKPLAIPIFKTFAVQHLATKIAAGSIKSAASKELWEGILRLHIFPAPFASYLATIITHDHIQEWWTEKLAPLVKSGEYSPITVNTWLNKLELIVNDMVLTHHMEENPMARIKRFDESEHGYTLQDPNSLRAKEVRPFLEKLEELYPQFLAFAYLGFFTGLRPSHMRPLRRSGPEADVLWDEGLILVHRSNSRGQEVMKRTKTKYHQCLALPDVLMDKLRWHVDHLPWTKQRTSDLLFPSRSGTLCARSILTKPFQEVAAAIGLNKRITPRGMRRTAVDLCRVSKMDETIKREVTGHRTEDMKHLYSTVAPDEMREAMSVVYQLVSGADTKAPTPPTAPNPTGQKGGHLKLVK